MSHPFERELAASWPPADWCDVRVVVAVSGGPDSVALLRGLHAIRSPGSDRLVVAHLNHGWRGAASTADAAFVAALADRLGLSCRVGWADEDAPRTEAGAREARRVFLQGVAGAEGARFVALGHTADDQAETILHRLVRGTGLRGLAGMPRARPFGPATLLRPLLHARRSHVLAYLADLLQPSCEDASNLDRRFTRNRLRRQLLPHLAARYNPRIVEALLRLGIQAAEWQALVQTPIDALLERGISFEAPGRLIFDRPSFAGQPEALAREAIRRAWRDRGWPEQAMDDKTWRDLSALLVDEQPASANRTFPSNVTAEVVHEKLVLQKKDPS